MTMKRAKVKPRTAYAAVSLSGRIMVETVSVDRKSADKGLEQIYGTDTKSRIRRVVVSLKE